MPRSRTARALMATSAGLVGAGAVVCAALAFTHAAHRSPQIASLAPVSATTDVPVGRGPTGLLAWQPPSLPAPVSLPPRVVEPVRIVVVTRHVPRRSAPTPPPSDRTTPARHVANAGAKPGPRTIRASTSRRTTVQTATAGDHASRHDERDDDEHDRDRQRDSSDEHERDDDE